MLKVTTVNVNGLRAAAKKGYREWLAATDADVVCLQEVRAEPHQLPDDVREPEGWHTVYAPAAAKGRAGVALLTRREPDQVRIGFGAAGVRGLRPVRGGGPARRDRRQPVPALRRRRHGAAGRRRSASWPPSCPYLRELRERAAADGREVLVCGDWNIAHQRGGPEELAREPALLGLPAGGTRVALPGLRPRGRRLRRRRTGAAPGRRRARTRGGPTGAAPSTTTRAGASIWSLTPGLAGRAVKAHGGAGGRRTTSAGATTRR